MKTRKPKMTQATKAAFDAAMDRICLPEIQEAYNGSEGWRGEPASLFDLLVQAEALGFCATTDEEKRAAAEEARQLHDQIRQAAIAVALWGYSGLRPSWASKRCSPLVRAKPAEMAEGEEPTVEDTTVDMAPAEDNGEPLSRGQIFVARAHFDLLRAISKGAGHSLATTPAVRDLLDAGLVHLDLDVAFMTPAGTRALAVVRPDCEGTALDHRRRDEKLIK